MASQVSLSFTITSGVAYVPALVVSWVGDKIARSQTENPLGTDCGLNQIYLTGGLTWLNELAG